MTVLVILDDDRSSIVAPDDRDESRPHVEIEHWFGSLRRRRRLFVGVVVGALVLGALLAFVQSPVYKATAEVVLGQSAGASLLGTTVTTPDLAAELKTARSDQVRQTAEAKLDRKGSVTVTADPTSTTLSFQGSASTAESAAGVANAYAAAYLTVRQQRADDEYQAALDRLRAKISDLDKKIAAVIGTTAPAQDARNALRSQQNAYRSAVDQLEVAAIVGGTSGARILTPAQPPSHKSSPLLRNYLAYALLAGLFLGAGAVGVAEFMDRSVKDAEGARAAAGGVPVLGRVKRGTTASGVVLLDAPSSAGSESYRSLRTTVQSMVESGWPFLQVTSVGEDDGAAEVAANLATALALTGEPTVLVSLEEFTGISFDAEDPSVDHPLTALLTGSAAPGDCLAKVRGVDNLSVIARSADENPDDVARRSIGEAVKHLQSLASTVVLLAPPVLGSAVALEVADLVDGTIVVVKERSTQAADLEQVTRSLSLMGSPVLGIVLS